MSRQEYWPSDMVHPMLATLRCPNCNSIFISSMGDSWSPLIHHYCRDCKHEWTKPREPKP